MPETLAKVTNERDVKVLGFSVKVVTGNLLERQLLHLSGGVSKTRGRGRGGGPLFFCFVFCCLALTKT